MASRRMIDPAFWESESIASLSFFERLVFIGLFSQADDQGRLKAHPALLSSKLFPFDGVPADDMIAALDNLVAAESILVYDVNGGSFVQLLNWWKYQHPVTATESRHPPPEGWKDRVYFYNLWGFIRSKVFERDEYICQYCGKSAKHIDHILPRCQGGTDDLDNLAAACAKCNLSKGGRTPKQAGMELRHAV